MKTCNNAEEALVYIEENNTGYETIEIKNNFPFISITTTTKNEEKNIYPSYCILPRRYVGIKSV